jgi:hypothetical protein
VRIYGGFGLDGLQFRMISQLYLCRPSYLLLEVLSPLVEDAKSRLTYCFAVYIQAMTI